MNPAIIRAGKANLFLSDVFAQTFVNLIGVPVELYDTDGSFGAAIGAGIGIKEYQSANEAFKNIKPLKVIEPDKMNLEAMYQNWKQLLTQQINSQTN